MLHGDNGTRIKPATVLAMLHWLGGKPSFDRRLWRQRLWESLSRRPNGGPTGIPGHGFADLPAAATWGHESCVITTNIGIAASAIVTAAIGCADKTKPCWQAHAVYQQVRSNPARWCTRLVASGGGGAESGAGMRYCRGLAEIKPACSLVRRQLCLLDSGAEQAMHLLKIIMGNGVKLESMFR